MLIVVLGTTMPFTHILIKRIILGGKEVKGVCWDYFTMENLT